MKELHFTLVVDNGMLVNCVRRCYTNGIVTVSEYSEGLNNPPSAIYFLKGMFRGITGAIPMKPFNHHDYITESVKGNS